MKSQLSHQPSRKFWTLNNLLKQCQLHSVLFSVHILNAMNKNETLDRKDIFISMKISIYTFFRSCFIYSGGHRTLRLPFSLHQATIPHVKYIGYIVLLESTNSFFSFRNLQFFLKQLLHLFNFCWFTIVSFLLLKQCLSNCGLFRILGILNIAPI